MPSTMVQQALHGYSDGHRLISASLSLSGPDARAMQVLSDLSGPGVKPPPAGYLTGYALEGAGKYVLARTWAAPEMPRPGCVWTHSLIVENADLAMMTSAGGLVSQFRRPDAASLRSYDAPVLIEDHGDRAAVAAINPRTRSILNSLYAAPDRMIVAEAVGESDETLVLSLWMQQWPRLRRVFSFCTFAGADRSLRSGPFDLQLIAGGTRSNRAKFPEALIPGEVEWNATLQPLLDDLEAPGRSELREFLRRVGGDVAGGRRAMPALCSLYSAVFDRSTPDLTAAVRALDKLEGAGRPQARTVRSLIVRQALERVDDVDPDVFDFLINVLAEDGAQFGGDAGARLAGALWRRAPEQFVDLLDSDRPLAEAAADALEALSVGNIVSELRTHPALAGHLVLRRPDLLESVEFWRSVDSPDALSHEALSRADAAKIAAAMVVAGRTTGSRAIIGSADPDGLARALNLATLDSPAIDDWLRALSENAAKAAAVMSSGALRHTWLLAALARRMEPDQHLPPSRGQDPWWTAIAASSGPLPAPERDEFAAYLTTRALGRRSASPEKLFRYAFTDTYRALERGRLSSDMQRLLIWRLDVGGWFEWEPHLRLKRTVVDRFISWSLDPEAFGRLADDGALAFSLFDEAARSPRGRRYLAEVRKALKGAREKGMKERSDYIAAKLK